METPLFEHHCRFCIFLGSFTDEQGIHHDLYFCPGRGRGSTGRVVSRWGDGPTGANDVHLGTLGSADGRAMLRFSAIREALRRAQAKGLAQQ